MDQGHADRHPGPTDNGETEYALRTEPIGQQTRDVLRGAVQEQHQKGSRACVCSAQPQVMSNHRIQYA